MSGKYEERSKPERTYQDMINEMAQELSNLPRVTAYAKVLQQKGAMGIQLTVKEKITTMKLQEPAFIDVLGEENAYERGKGYCQERTEIEKEIIERQGQRRRRR